MSRVMRLDGATIDFIGVEGGGAVQRIKHGGMTYEVALSPATCVAIGQYMLPPTPDEDQSNEPGHGPVLPTD